MPYYDYECPKCGAFEVEQRMSDPALERHEVCGSPVERLVSAAAVHGGTRTRDTGATCQPEGCARPGCARAAN